MKILLLGGSGMLGTDCKNVLMEEHEVIAPARKELDIISWDGVIEHLQELLPDVVINCAGVTDLEACEGEDFAIRKVNVEGPRNLAQGAARFQCRFIHVSCDYIFDGQKVIPQPYFEDDTTNPLSGFGRTKRDSETAVRENSPNYVIVRTGWLYGLPGENFLKDVLRRGLAKKKETLRVPNDEFGSPTWTYRLALQIRELLRHNGRGTYHATAEGCCSRFEAVKHVLDKLGLKARVKPFPMKDCGIAIKRPANAVLENRNLKKQDVNVMQPWGEDLDLFLDKHGQELIKGL